VLPELYAVIVRPFRGGEKGDPRGWCGCIYFKGFTSEKYFAISSWFGGWRRMLDSEDETWGLYEYETSLSEARGIVVAASGVEAYSSCNNVRPRAMTGVVAYTGIRVNRGRCLQQCANAPRCDIVACVSRTMDRVGTCLQIH
jgi:hypothetical protein